MNAKKVKINITLDEYATALYHEAMKTAFPFDFSLKSDKRRLIDLSLIAVFRAIIEQNLKLKNVLAAELREETPTERCARIAGEIPKRDAKNSFPYRNRWN
jgi:hypothetical protein